MKKDLLKRLNKIQNKIEKAALRADRDPQEIKLLPISKTQPVEKIKFFQKQGLTVFGESRAQELREKNKKLKNLDLNWHFVGHLQRNKVKYLMRMENCKMIHSLDSLRLAREIDKRANKNNRKIKLLVEVNVARDENKYGIKPEETGQFVKKTAPLENIKLAGLMTLAPHTDDPEETRPYFQELVHLKEKINDNGFNLNELSMGMTNDFEVAIEEGATIVRIGRALFGARNY